MEMDGFKEVERAPDMREGGRREREYSMFPCKCVCVSACECVFGVLGARERRTTVTSAV